MLKEKLENFDTLKLEIAVLSVNKKQLEEVLNEKKQALESIKNDIDNTMKAGKKTAVAEHGFVINYRNSAKVVITDESALPSEAFEVVKKVVTLTKMRNLIKTGIVQAGAIIEQQKNIQIKKIGDLESEEEEE